MKLGFNPFSLRKKVKHWQYVASQQAIIRRLRKFSNTITY
ncbi:hypothetical protein PMCN06_1383 [Pasteurella multocida subsp. multocida str. HN06]|nr:hypothetical protein PMCN06_1383 [Pasteurella multocida subsp. multocida str. HN06]EPE63752.1 hypothetical protein I141_12239 [Pasteurella multocida P1933]